MIGAAWVLTVALTSTLVWMVIAAVGAHLTQTTTVPRAADAAPAESLPGSHTWTGTGGRLTASCTDTAIALVGGIPELGYWVKVYDPGPLVLRVDFESTDPDDRHEVRLSATCRDGVPVFTHI